MSSRSEIISVTKQWRTQKIHWGDIYISKRLGARATGAPLKSATGKTELKAKFLITLFPKHYWDADPKTIAITSMKDDVLK